MSPSPALIALYWEKVVVNPDGCWGWSAGHGGKDGRAMISLRGEQDYAYRVSYEIHHGPITDGLHVCHSCDNPECSRPDHLWLGTAKDNLQDAAQKGRLGAWGRGRTHCKRGHEFTPENTYLLIHKSDGKEHRHCRTCTEERARAWHEANYVPRPEATHCRSGHPWDEANTRMSRTDPPHRICRACERRRKADWKARKARREQARAGHGGAS